MPSVDTPPRWYWVIAWLSLVPGLGLPFALVTAVLALRVPSPFATRFGAIAFGGILLSGGGGLMAWLFYTLFFAPGSIHAELRQQMTPAMVSTLVPKLELYRVQHGAYPERLSELESDPMDPFRGMLRDMSQVRSPFSLPPYFHYERTEGGYYLLAVGPDGIPYTPDDLLPDVPTEDRERLGLRVHPGSRPEGR